MVKLAAIALVSSLVALSNAVVFSVVSVGQFTLVGGGYTTAENVISQVTPSPLNTLAFTATYVGAGANGNMVYTGGAGTVTLAFTAPGPFVFQGNTSSLNGSWTYTSGTGAYASYTGGSGTFAAVYNTSGNYASTTLSGDLNPVPEPATLAVLGLGVLALRRRVRNS
jgi:hypothetical protein